MPYDPETRILFARAELAIATSRAIKAQSDAFVADCVARLRVHDALMRADRTAGPVPQHRLAPDTAR